MILAFEGTKTVAHIRDILEGEGIASCLICHSAAEVKRLAHKQHIDTVICGHKLRDDTAERVAEDLSGFCSVLVIAQQSYLDLLGGENIFKLAAPVSRSDLTASVQILLQESHQGTWSQRSEEEHRRINAAKAVLMERNGMTEEQAHRFLQKRSMDQGMKLVQTAQMVLDSL